MTGLKIIVNYDDYSSETADMSQVKLVSGYDGPLAPENIYVRVQYQNKLLQIRIVVTAENTDTNYEEPSEKSGCNGCSSETILGGAGSAAVALGIVSVIIAVSAIVKRKRNTDEN